MNREKREALANAFEALARETLAHANIPGVESLPHVERETLVLAVASALVRTHHQGWIEGMDECVRMAVDAAYSTMAKERKK